jgi:Protein of unknown function (DUF1759)
MAQNVHQNERDFISGQRTASHEVVTTQHNAQALTEPEIDYVLQDLNTLRNRLEAHEQLTYTLYTDPTDRAAQIALDAVIKEDLRATTTIARTIKATFPQPVAVAVPAPQHSINLPRIELPTFIGGHEEFPPWKERFNSMVHHNNTLSDIDKLSYLRMSVKGGIGKGIVNSYPNYANAYNALTTYFEQTRTNAYIQIKKLFEIPAVHHPSGKTLTDLVSGVHAAARRIRGLRAGGLSDADFNNLVMLHIIRSRLDKSTRKEFDQSRPTDTIPTLDEITEYVNRKARAFDDNMET